MIGFIPESGFGVPPGQPLRLGLIDFDAASVAAKARIPCDPRCPTGGGSYGGSLAVANAGGSEVIVSVNEWSPGPSIYGWGRIDASTGAWKSFVADSPQRHSVLRHPYSGELVGSAQGAGPVLTWTDPTTLMTSLSIGLSLDIYDGSPSIAFSADGRVLFAAIAGRLFKYDAHAKIPQASRAFHFPPYVVVDPRRNRLYTYDWTTQSLFALDADTLETVWRLYVTTTGIEGGLAMDARGRLLVQLQEPGSGYDYSGSVLVVDPDRGLALERLTMLGTRFVKGGRSGRLYRIGRGSCDPPGSGCPSEALHEFDASTYEHMRSVSLRGLLDAEFGLPSHTVKFAWIAFVPRHGESIEYYHAGLDHWFLTADPAEIEALDRGVLAGWSRTGERFPVMLNDAGMGASRLPVCRYYGRPERGLNSHFYSASSAECDTVGQGYDGAWIRESADAFYVVRANEISGSCHEGTQPVYRLWNARVDSNHRYTTSAVIKAEMIGRGYIPEGYGPDAVAFCVTG